MRITWLCEGWAGGLDEEAGGLAALGGRGEGRLLQA
jgi:hypothetical protein